MPRYRLTVEYDGEPYRGFQAQAGQASVQGELERAIAAFAGEAARVHAAGRTDAGVHAAGQVVHFDLIRDWPAKTVMEAINAHLRSAPIAVLDVRATAASFHARFSALARHYRYRILNRPGPPALDAGRVWHLRAPLDDAAMHDAAQVLVGRHDFTTFRDAACQAASPVKTVDAAAVTREADEVLVAFSARSFLHRQVRSMVGALVFVGQGKWSKADLIAALEAKDRAACPPVAPAAGLTLMTVDYPPENAPG